MLPAFVAIFFGSLGNSQSLLADGEDKLNGEGLPSELHRQLPGISEDRHHQGPVPLFLRDPQCQGKDPGAAGGLVWIRHGHQQRGRHQDLLEKRRQNLWFGCARATALSAKRKECSPLPRTSRRTRTKPTPTAAPTTWSGSS
ncbi:hypothetical protein L596_016047 [Steinernema carpocapsae]|uniref:Uncharacterized protein n=1 Tax=Steinernema carpocapsae TaxID=34508 RepID=A0A4V6A395_STECR|nr:hypothetical protein L596_016047 [Steinernema carpocapsae]